jgi:hypothetical protein
MRLLWLPKSGPSGRSKQPPTSPNAYGSPRAVRAQVRVRGMAPPLAEPGQVVRLLASRSLLDGSGSGRQLRERSGANPPLQLGAAHGPDP